MNGKNTLAELFVDSNSEAPAVVSVSPSLVVSYRALAEQIERLAEDFSGTGLQKGEAVALVLPNGLEFLTVFLTLVRVGLVAVPLNLAATTDELTQAIDQLDARAVVAEEGNFAVKKVAGSLGRWCWPSSVDSRGMVTLAGLSPRAGHQLDCPSGDDIAVLARTSGTTGQPKVVPLTHANIAWSANNIASHYRLTPADRSLLVLPLFHGHGLIGCALSTLASGGTLIVPPRFSASAFWQLCSEHRATWFSGVPTIHQILLERADGDNAPHSGLRFIRSCSAPLATATREKLEDRFGAPALEAYGMTEAAHQVASNPLPPLLRKPGTLGIGHDIAIIDQQGQHQPVNCSGEVIIRGPNVMRGYRNDPEANAAAFIDGWFRTGDIGFLDRDGYLRLAGRIKELINRGGEKVFPSEVEGVLLKHPAIAEAAVFGVRDAKYGEEVAAAVVRRSNCSAGELQKFCRDQMADFKVPKFIYFTTVLPKNAMGKVQRRDVEAQFSGSHPQSTV